MDKKMLVLSCTERWAVVTFHPRITPLRVWRVVLLTHDALEKFHPSPITLLLPLRFMFMCVIIVSRQRFARHSVFDLLKVE